MAENFKSGDIVQLKSGGPKMTVDDTDPELGVRAIWFDGTTKLDGLFAPETLKLADD